MLGIFSVMLPMLRGDDVCAKSASPHSVSLTHDTCHAESLHMTRADSACTSTIDTVIPPAAK